MSREAWGDPPDPEPECCPMCGQSHHTDGCEVCDLDIQRINAEGEAMRLRADLRDLALMIGRLVTALRKARPMAPLNLDYQALDLLARKGLSPSPLRQATNAEGAAGKAAPESVNDH